MSSRRNFIGGLAAGIAAATEIRAATFDRLLKSQSDPHRRILLRGGTILSLDAQTGDHEHADLLIEGKKISAIAPTLPASGAIVVDASGMIVMPGFVDTHHHQYETALRSILSDGNLGLYSDPKQNYISVIQGILTPAYLPEDAYISELVASWSQLNAGVTTTVDLSQVSHTPAHSDACIQGLKDSGRRAVYSYSAGSAKTSQFPQDIVRIQKQFFSSKEQLLTLALNTGTNAEHWKLARSLNLPITSHIVGDRFGDLEKMGEMGLMGPDNEYVHCTNLSENVWKRIADTGGKLSIAPAIEMQMRHGMPPFQLALDHGITPSLSVDVECNMTADMFSIMRAAFTLQRALANERAIAGDKNAPKTITCREVIEMATIAGARVAHLDSKIGTLSPGKEADVILLDSNRINVFPMNNVPGTVVTMMDSSNVEHVFVAGQLKKWSGKLVGVDQKKLQLDIEKSRDGILARANFAKNLFGTCCS